MPETSIHCDTCSLCDQPLRLILPLAPTPPANEILSTNEKRDLFPLNLMQCVKCQHLQLDTEISMFRLFKHYVYTSNTSASNFSYFNQYAKDMLKLNPRFVVDIGSNDGMFLHFFQQAGCRVMGVDPAENIVEIANANNVETQCNFFNQMVAWDISQRRGKADLITCNNMFAHNRNLDEVLLGVKELLTPGGTFVFEVSYGLSMLENNLFDLIYHEHFHHWTIAPAIKYFDKFGLSIVDAELISQTHGGSIRFYVKFPSVQPATTRLHSLLKIEQETINMHIRSFVKQVPDIKKRLSDLLNDLWFQGKQISIMGYPAKACTLTYYLGLNTGITKVYDNNPLKIGKYTHQGQIIEPATNIVKDKPDYLLLLSWNYKDELLKKYRHYTKSGGKFIVPLPALDILP